MFALNANVVVNLINYALRTSQVERLIAVFNETEYAILTVKINEVCGLKIAPFAAFITARIEARVSSFAVGPITIS